MADPVVRLQPVDSLPPILSAPQLIRGFKPVESIVDGLQIARGGVTSLTAGTGHGKTTLTTALEVAVCRGLPFAGREVTVGSVLVLAGENPDDYTMHLMATLQDLGLTPEDMQPNSRDTGELLVIPGVFDIDFRMDDLRARVTSLGRQLVLVAVDTSAAFYRGEEENGNVEMMRHATLMRELATLPGRPAVIVNCHPTKNAQQDNLVPRGGGAFLTQVDANLTLWKDTSGVVTLHHGKIRGPSFDPIRFEIASVELAAVKDCRGNPILSSVVRHLKDEHAEQLQAKDLDDGNRLLVAMLRKPDSSMAQWQLACGFTYKAKVSRLLLDFVADRLAEKARGGIYRLTLAGKKEAERVL